MGNNEKQIYYREIILNIKKLPFSWKLSEIRKFPEVYKQREVDYNGVKCTLFNGDWTCHKSRLMDYSSNLGEILEINLLESECHIRFSIIMLTDFVSIWNCVKNYDEKWKTTFLFCKDEVLITHSTYIKPQICVTKYRRACS